jgi:hypothetical protein
MSLPKDVLELRSAPDSPAAALGLRWCREDEVPPGYLDVPDLDPQMKKAWETMFRELTFVAEGPEGEWIALWRHGPGVAPERAPVVVLDTEGQLQCRAATVADLLHGMAEDPGPLEAWCEFRSIELSPDPACDVRFVPDPNGRCQALQEGDTAPLPARAGEPEGLEDVLGMSGADGAVARAIGLIESFSHRLEIQCDRAGRVATIFLTPETLRKPVKVRGISLRDPPSALAALGKPDRSGPGWSRWDRGDVALHVEAGDRGVSRITLMLKSSLPPHLR